MLWHSFQQQVSPACAVSGASKHWLIFQSNWFNMIRKASFLPSLLNIQSLYVNIISKRQDRSLQMKNISYTRRKTTAHALNSTNIFAVCRVNRFDRWKTSRAAKDKRAYQIILTRWTWTKLVIWREPNGRLWNGFLSSLELLLWRRCRSLSFTPRHSAAFVINTHAPFMHVVIRRKFKFSFCLYVPIYHAGAKAKRDHLYVLFISSLIQFVRFSIFNTAFVWFTVLLLLCQHVKMSH